MKRHVRFLPVCPEMEIGMGVLRERIVIVRNDRRLTLYQPATGRRLTRIMNRFARDYLKSLDGVDGFILKSRSPSCAISDVKQFEGPQSDAKTVNRGPGLFAARVLSQFGHLAIEDERRLEDSQIRDRWLTKLFTLADFRLVRKTGSLSRLTAFHAFHRYLLQVHSRKHTDELDRLLSDMDSSVPVGIWRRYEDHLRAALQKAPRLASVTRVAGIAFRHYAPHLDVAEKRRFRRLLHSYRSGHTPLSGIRKTIQVWGVRYDKSLIRAHSFFRPYPAALGE
jgi:uncharacterized protein YbgA (DUF1722 family)/uncharacterized protein YbbK (DUF523 family)